MTVLVLALSIVSFLGWIYLVTARHIFWKPFVFQVSPLPTKWPSVDIIVPARNEAESLPGSLSSLLNQNYPGKWRVLLVDDHSEDQTGDVARQIAARMDHSERLVVLSAPALPEGWSGKVAAMQAGVLQSNADYILFTDADIEHPKTDSLCLLVARAVERKLDLVSLMVKLHCTTFAEKLLIPAFVYFFAMLYPFRAANNPNHSLAAAAGGVMLVRHKALENIGGLMAIRSALIDDCSLAHELKHHGGDKASGGTIELSLSADVKSLRVYQDIGEVWRMIARTAFTQLNYSNFLLIGTIVGMTLLFIVPFVLPLFASFLPASLGFSAAFLLLLTYIPMILFYRLPLVWVLTLPVAAAIYMAATIDSARLYWQGKGGQWKGRAQA